MTAFTLTFWVYLVTLTVVAMFFVLPSLKVTVAVMFAEPFALAVTVPSAPTDATPALDDV